MNTSPDTHMEPQKIHVNGVELHYIACGTGEPLVFVHGGVGDYRSWEPQLGPFSQHFRVVSYSQRYSYPNRNPVIVPNHSAFTEAGDLAALMRQLTLGRVHLVGASHGAYAALVLALQHPEMVRTLVLAEPPVHRWVTDVPGGKALFEEFLTTVHEPVGSAFRRGEPHEAMRIFTNSLGGPGSFERLSPAARAQRLENARALQALTQSADAFPMLAREAVQRLTVPTLLVEGEKTIKLHKLVDDELLRCIPGSARVIIPHATHRSAGENPEAFNSAVLTFLSKSR
jgi:pimeloyl-ACP methyl ester carboxylesterase